jgi:hypothetical protein
MFNQLARLGLASSATMQTLFKLRLRKSPRQRLSATSLKQLQSRKPRSQRVILRKSQRSLIPLYQLISQSSTALIYLEVCKDTDLRLSKRPSEPKSKI